MNTKKRIPVSVRLNQLMQEQNLRPSDVLERAKPYCEEFQTTLGKSALSNYMSGKFEPNQRRLSVLARVFGVQETWLMGLDVTRTREEEMTQLEALEKAFNDRPDMRYLFSVAQKATPEEINQAIKIIEALQK